MGSRDFGIASEEIVGFLGRIGVSNKDNFGYPYIDRCLTGIREIETEFVKKRRKFLPYGNS